MNDLHLVRVVSSAPSEKGDEERKTEIQLQFAGHHAINNCQKREFQSPSIT